MTRLMFWMLRLTAKAGHVGEFSLQDTVADIHNWAYAWCEQNSRKVWILAQPCTNSTRCVANKIRSWPGTQLAQICIASMNAINIVKPSAWCFLVVTWCVNIPRFLRDTNPLQEGSYPFLWQRGVRILYASSGLSPLAYTKRKVLRGKLCQFGWSAIRPYQPSSESLSYES